MRNSKVEGPDQYMIFLLKKEVYEDSELQFLEVDLKGNW